MATEVIVTAEHGHLVGKTASDAEALDALEGGTYRAVLTEPQGRSLSQLRLWFGACQMIAENYPGDFTKDNVDQTLRIECGHVEIRKDARGAYWRYPKSIAFNKMGQTDFNALMDRMWSKAAELFGAGLAESVRDELDRMAAPDLAKQQEAA